MTIEEINSLYDTLKEEYTKKSAIKEKLKKDLIVEKEKIEEYHKEIEIYEKKKKLIQDAASEARKFSKELFESNSTEALQAILGDNLSVEVKLGESGGTQTADFLVKANYEDGSEVVVDPTNEDGGGVADIIALASLISMNSFVSDENSAPLVLDEPTKYVSKGNAKDVALFLSETSKNMNKQIIMVTHDGVSKDFADKAYKIHLDEDGNSVAEDVTKKEV